MAMRLRQRPIPAIRDREELVTIQLSRADVELMHRLADMGYAQSIDAYNEAEGEADDSEVNAAARICGNLQDLLQDPDFPDQVWKFK